MGNVLLASCLGNDLGQIPQFNFRTGTKGYSPLDGITQLPNVAWPAVDRQSVQRFGGKRPRRAAGACGKLRGKLRSHIRNIAWPLAQCRQVKTDNIEPVIKIGTETT